MIDLFIITFNISLVLLSVTVSLLLIATAIDIASPTQSKRKKTSQAPPLTILLRLRNSSEALYTSIDALIEQEDRPKQLQVIIISKRNNYKTAKRAKHYIHNKYSSIRVDTYTHSAQKHAHQATKEAYVKYRHYKSGTLLTLDSNDRLRSQKKSVYRHIKVFAQSSNSIWSIYPRPTLTTSYIGLLNALVLKQRYNMSKYINSWLVRPVATFASGTLVQSSVLQSSNYAEIVWTKQVLSATKELVVLKHASETQLEDSGSLRSQGSRDLLKSVSSQSVSMKWLLVFYCGQLVRNVITIVLGLVIAASLMLAFSVTTLQPIALLGITFGLWLLVLIWAGERIERYQNNILLSLSIPALIAFNIVTVFPAIIRSTIAISYLIKDSISDFYIITKRRNLIAK